MSPLETVLPLVVSYTVAALSVLPDIVASECPEPLRALEADQAGSGGGGCRCNDLAEVRCYGLSSVPRFSPMGNSRIFYRGIYISRQNITSIDPGSFTRVRVRKIVLEFNPIEDRIHEDSFEDLSPGLRELHLGGCRIGRLPGKLLWNLSLLRHLYLWGNRLDAIHPRFFRGTRNLRELVLWGNRLEELDEDLFDGLTQLRRLDLDQNRMAYLTRSTFRHLAQLEVLHLGRNKIHAITANDAFSENVGLRVLTIDRNGLEFVYPDVFDSLSNLTSLSLDHNSIEILPSGVFSNLKRLTVLDLRNNNIERPWEATFSGLRSLRVLYLSDNRISRLPGKVFRVSSELRHLFLDQNNVSTLGQCALPTPGRLKLLSLTGNPLVCNCQLAWILKFSGTGRNFKVFGSCYGGNTPSSANVQLASVLTNLSSISCPDATFNNNCNA